MSLLNYHFLWAREEILLSPWIWPISSRCQFASLSYILPSIKQVFELSDPIIDACQLMTYTSFPIFLLITKKKKKMLLFESFWTWTVTSPKEVFLGCSNSYVNLLWPYKQIYGNRLRTCFPFILVKPQLQTRVVYIAQF